MKPLPSLFEVERQVKAAAKKKPVRPRIQIALAPEAVVMGLDLSLTSTGVALWEMGHTRHTTVCPKFKGLFRIDYLAAEICEMCQSEHVSLVCVEGLVSYSKDAYHNDTVGCWYVCALGLMGAGIPVVAAHPSTLKVFVYGAGGAKKEHMMMAVLKRYGVECTNSDEADAIGLAHFGAALAGLEVPNLIQGECLAKAWRVE